MFIKRLPKFVYHVPKSVSEALDLLTKYSETAKVFAGGTDLLVSMKKREIAPEHLINLKGIAELRGIHHDPREGIRIGALVTLEEIEHSKIVKDKFCVLWDAVNVMASSQVRSLGTIGGNLCSAVPSADTAPPLIALGASVKMVGIHGERSVLVENFFKGPKESVLQRNEILTQILLPNPPQRSSGAYLKLMRRSALDLAIVGVAAFLRLDPNKQICSDARIALGAVAPTPIRAPMAEEILIHKEIDEVLAGVAGKAASMVCRPIDDIRSSLEYRCNMVEVLTKRAVMDAYRRIR
jgi:aerobic carbon-monoxide dehydrogenase medium subunit